MVVSALGARLAPPSKITPKQYSYLAMLVIYTSGMTFLMKKSRAANPLLANRGLYSIPTSILMAELLKFVVSLAVEYHNRQKSSSQYKAVGEQPDAELEAGLSSERDEHVSAGDKSNNEEAIPAENERRKRSSSSISSLASFISPSTDTSKLEEDLHSLYKDVLAPDCWKLGVPAALYVAQNLLQMVAITTVSPVTYQAVTQCKLLATTLLSVWLLSRLYSYEQWTSIFVLLIGVIVVSVSKIKESSSASSSQRAADAIVAAKMFGVFAVLAACTLGSGAAVYMEKVLKSDVKTSLWIRNAQLSLFSLIPAATAVLYEAYNQGAWHPFQWFGAWAWSTVIARSIGGFLVALILKHTDALLKGIATSIAMVLSIFVESVLYDVPISATFAFGALLVVASSCVYVRSGLKTGR
jgi:UDP-galactose transporter